MSVKVQKGKEEELSHHGLIKLIMCDALERQIAKVSWEDFIIMRKEEFISLQDAFKETILIRDSRSKKKSSKVK